MRGAGRGGSCSLRPARVPSGPFPCGKRTPTHRKRSAETAHGGEGPSEASEADVQDQHPEDLPPTDSPLYLQPFNKTEASPVEDSSNLIRIVGGQNCPDGECPWQVTAEWAWRCRWVVGTPCWLWGRACPR